MFISTVILLFFIYSFMGWISEVVYCSIIERRFVNRGFLYGPLCPVYGFGGLFVVGLLQPFSGNVFLLFIMAVVLTSVVEYCTGWALETMFSTKWWDYSQYRFNIHGRVCLLNSIIFGVLGVLAIHFIHPVIMSFLGMIPVESRQILASAFSVAVFIDISFTLRSLVDFKEKITVLSEFMESVRTSIDFGEWFNDTDLKGSLERIRDRARLDASEFNIRISSKLEEILERAKGMRHLLSAFPGMTSRRHNEQLAVFKRLFAIGKPDKKENPPKQPTTQP